MNTLTTVSAVSRFSATVGLRRKRGTATALGLRRLLMACAAAIVALAMAGEAHATDKDAIVKAVKFDDVSGVAKFLKRGIDPNMTDDDGMPLLVIAAREKSDNVAKLLIDNPNIDVEKVDAHDENAMMLAALNGDVDLVKQLIAKGAEVNKKGWAPLHYAAANGHDDIARLLIDNSAYIDAASPNGTTPLMMAARGNHVTTMKVLLDGGADAKLKNQIGMTALDFAKRYQAKDAAEALQDMFARERAASSGVPAREQNSAK